MKLLINTLFLFLLTAQVCFAQWVQLGLSGQCIKDIAVRDSNIFAVAIDFGPYHGEMFRSTDNGTNWTMIVDSNVVDVDISPTGKVLMIIDGELYWNDSLYSSIDNGDTWTSVNIMEQLQDSIQAGEPHSLTLSPGGVVFCNIRRQIFGYADAIAKSTDDGITWTTPGESVLGGKFFDFRGQLVITIGELVCVSTCYGCYIYQSSDNGNTWDHLEDFGFLYNPNCLGLFSNGNIITDRYEGSNYSIYISTNMCSTWTMLSSTDCQVGRSWSKGFSAGMLIGTTSYGVLVFSDEGDSLGTWNDGLHYSWDVLTLTNYNNEYVYLGQGANIMFGSGGVWRRLLSEIIPVELTSFTATTNGKEVILNWSTATELNNLGFEIQRSTQETAFCTVGFVNGHGTTTGQQNYSYSDKNLSDGKYYYRLKQVDYDGSFEYSEAVEVEWKAFNSYLLEQNYPNPFNPVTTIGFGIQNKSDVIITILNIIGEEVAVVLNEEKEAGFHKVEFNAGDLPSGVYFYQLKAGEFVQTKKMIFIK